MTGRVVVTGAAGFIGAHACRALLERGWAVCGIDNFDPFYDRSIKEQGLALLTPHEGFEFMESDVRDAAAMREAIRGCDAVVHLAARAGVRPSIQQPELYSSVNVGGTASVLAACHAGDVRRVVFGSSSSVYGDATPVPFREDAPAVEPISPYAATKRAAELQCRVYSHLHDFRVAVLRFFTVYGPRQRPDLAIHKFTRLIEAGERIQQYGDGSSERDYTHISDILQGITAAVDWIRRDEPAYEVFNLGESETVRLSVLIQLIADALGVAPRIEVLPPAPGDVGRTCADITKARRELEYDPRVSIQEGIPEFVDWFQATHGCTA